MGSLIRANGFSNWIFGAKELNGSFVFNILDNENDYSMLINSFESIKDVGFFKLSDYTEYFQNSIDSCKDYYLSHQEDYFVNISKLDIEHDIIEVLSFLN